LVAVNATWQSCSSFERSPASAPEKLLKLKGSSRVPGESNGHDRATRPGNRGSKTSSGPSTSSLSIFSTVAFERWLAWLASFLAFQLSVMAGWDIRNTQPLKAAQCPPGHFSSSRRTGRALVLMRTRPELGCE
jgi:hypothetical protein